MILLFGGVVLGLLLFLWGFKMDSDWGALPGGGGALMLLTAVVLGMAAGCNKATIRGDLVRVAELRRVAAAVDLNASEAIAGKVADTNIEIRQNQWVNRQWWGDVFVPDEWDTVTVLPTPDHAH